MDRRRFLLTSLAGAVVWPLAAEGQQARKVHRIGFLSGSSATAASRFVEQFQQGLGDLGYMEGQNITTEYRWAEGRQDRLADLATELVRTGPDLIVAATSPPAMALNKATGTIPVVMITWAIRCRSASRRVSADPEGISPD